MVEDAEDDVEEIARPETPNPMALDNFALSEPVKETLRKKGYDTLFAIQAETLSIALSGKDVVGRARTGCGKTLAFVLPIVEEMAKMSPTPASFELDGRMRPLWIGQKEGGNLLTGGERIEELAPGAFMQPTLMQVGDNAMRVCQEEIFGPFGV